MQETLPFSKGNIVDISIREEMRNSFIDYAMSVIISRALPDVRDGLKPVHRRILYAMYELGMYPDKPFKKSARLVGEVLGKYHPHGDTSVYSAMVRMVQNFSSRYPLVDGQGNFGSIDDDPPAAMRYTEARLSKIATEMLLDIENDTVDFTSNFDGTLEEPIVMPSSIPNLLINGSTGIAVGMATNIPPHNLSEVIDAIIYLIDNKEASNEDLMKFIHGPDFPTGGIIMGTKGIKDAYTLGRGSITIRSVVETEIRKNRNLLVVKEIPYQVNKTHILERIADLVQEKKIDGISDLRDESDRDGLRIVIELKRDAIPNVVLNNLYKYTDLQASFGVIMLALVDNQPKILNLREIIEYYLKHRFEVTTRRIQFYLKNCQRREHIVQGLLKIQDDLDTAIDIVRQSPTVAEAQERLIEHFNLSVEQASSVLEMQLRKLTVLEKQKLQEENKQLCSDIENYRSILNNENQVYEIIKNELIRIKNTYGDKRRTKLLPDPGELKTEDLIPNDQMAVFMTDQGYIKRISVDTFEKQKRGGVGKMGMATRAEDFIQHFFIASNHTSVLFFTNKGIVFTLKVYEIPEASRQAKGSSIANLLQLNQDDKITAVIPVIEFKDSNNYLVMLTRKGIIKRTPIQYFQNIRKNGLIAIGLKEGDELGWVKCTNGNQRIIIGTQNGMSIYFSEDELRDLGRSAQGVKAITLREGDQVIGFDIISENQDLLTVTTNGYGKRTPISEYRLQSRAGKGIINMKLRKNGKVAGILAVDGHEEIVIVTSNGIVIRQKVAEISRIGRPTKGVKLQKIDQNDQIVGLALVLTD